MPLIYIATNIDIEKNINRHIGIDIDIEEIKSIFVDFYGIFTGLTYSIFKTNFIQLQSRPIQMRGTILYLANRWMDFKMLSTPNSF